MTKADIQSRDDIVIIINTFYNKVQQDDLLKNYFKNVNWDAHLPVMYDFWENILFYTGGYSGNPMEKHKAVLQKMPLQACHFERWVSIFRQVVNTLYKGNNSKAIIERAESIAKIMEIKLLGNDNRLL